MARTTKNPVSTYGGRRRRYRAVHFYTAPFVASADDGHMLTQKAPTRKLPAVVAVVRLVNTRLSRMEDLLIEMQGVDDVKRKKINRLQEQISELAEVVRRRVI
jgi:hypothetical protein